MAASRCVYDSRHLQANCQEPDQLRNPMLGNRVWATFTLPLPFLNWGCRLTQVDLCNGHTKVVVVLVVVLFVVR